MILLDIIQVEDLVCCQLANIVEICKLIRLPILYSINIFANMGSLSVNHFNLVLVFSIILLANGSHIKKSS